MATVNYSVLASKKDTKIVLWPGLTGGDEGQAIDLSDYPDKTVQVIGPTFDGAVTLQGSGYDDNYNILTDSLGIDLSFTAAGSNSVKENLQMFKPVVAAGTSENTVVLVCAK